MPPGWQRYRRWWPGSRLPGCFVAVAVIILMSVAAMPARAAVVSNIQTGAALLANGQQSVRVTVTAVDPARSFVIASAHLSNEAKAPADAHVSVRLDGNATLVFERDGTVGQVDVAWTVVEYASGVTVRRGTATASVSEPAAVIDLGTVNLARSFPLVTHRGQGVQVGCNDFVRTWLEAPGRLHLNRRCAGLPTIIEWQVVEHDGVLVRSGDVAMAAGATSAKAVVPPLDRTTTWLLFSYDSEAGNIADTGQKLVRGEIENPAQLSFDRASSGQAMTLTYHAVTFEDGSRVYTGASAFGAAVDTMTPTIAAVDATRSFVAFGTSLGSGRVALVDGSFSAGRFSAALTSPTQIRVRRGISGALPADVTWSVLELAGPPLPDAGVDAVVMPDAAVMPTDAVVNPTDGAVSPTDGAVSPTDGAVSPTDGAVNPTDGAVNPTDGAVNPADAGVNPTDATGGLDATATSDALAMGADAGFMPDAAGVASDGGAAIPDAGAGGVDADAAVVNLRVGCACRMGEGEGSGVGALLLVAFVLLPLRRRGHRSKSSGPFGGPDRG